jgi:hypothetical protein
MARVTECIYDIAKKAVGVVREADRMRSGVAFTSKSVKRTAENEVSKTLILFSTVRFTD